MATKPTVLIKYKGSMYETFDKAKDGLAGLAFEVDGTPMDIEVVHHEYRFKPSLFPILFTHPAVGAYEGIREGLVEQLCASTPSPWTMTSLFLVGPYLEKSAPAIVVMVCSRSVYNWTEIVSYIRMLIMYHDPSLSMDIDIIIIPGDINSSTNPN